MRRPLLLLFLFVWGTTPALATAETDAQLIAFVRGDASAMNRRFADETVPALRKMADERGLHLVLVDVAEGAPAEIHCVPAVVFANHRGRSIYQGRSTTLDRVRNFVQTARVMPQGERRLERTAVPVSKRGRMTIGTPIKIGALSGTPPPDFDEAAFQDELRAAIGEGMNAFHLAERAEFGRTDRLFYIDFYPHRAADGTLFLSTALFSQFHCHTPLFTRFDEPVTGGWEARRDVIAKAAAELELRIEAAIQDAEIGDGFVAIEGVPVVSWSDLGLTLPERPAGVSGGAVDIEVPNAWGVDTAAHVERAPILFRFPAPLDSYTGQATELTGEVKFTGGRIDSMSGAFTAPVRSVTMGEDDLDAHLQSADMLAANAHPESQFVIESARSDREPTLEFGVLVPVRLTGAFSMKGRTIPIEVAGQLELTIGRDGRPRLLLQGTWSIDLLNQFAIEGPDGPEELRHTLLYTCDIVLAPR